MTPTTEKRSYWPVVSLVMLILFGLLNIFTLLFYSPRINNIYHDIFPGAALPKMTQILIAARLPLAFVILAWGVAAIVMVKRRHPTAIYIVSIGLFLFLALLAITAYALVYLPVDSVANGTMGEPYIP
jgi:hypothetical protein